MDIVLKAQPLVVEARVRLEDSDDVRKGQKTEVRFTALQGCSLPIIHGAVNAISADQFEDQRTGQGFFLAEIIVTREEITRAAQSKGMKSLSLLSGLPAETVIPLRKRSVLQYLIEPLTQTLWGSFRQEYRSPVAAPRQRTLINKRCAELPKFLPCGCNHGLRPYPMVTSCVLRRRSTLR